MNVPEVAVHGKNRSADSYNLPDIGQRDHTDYEQECSEVRHLLRQYFVLPQSEHNFLWQEYYLMTMMSDY